MDSLISVTICNGKYTIREKEPYKWECLRYGEPWEAYSDRGPNNLEMALAYEVSELRKKIEELTKEN